MAHRVLIVDDDENIRFSLNQLFTGRGYDVRLAGDAASCIALLKEKPQDFFPDVMLLDVQLPDRDGLDVLQEIHEEYSDLCILIITGYGSVPQSVEAMHKGAADYVLKPFNFDEILLRINKSMGVKKLEDQVGFLSRKAYGDWEAKYIFGENPIMRQVWQQVQRVASSKSSTVFIHGETGTGKEVIAQRIHALSDRSDQPFVEINATALSAELLESELFGHEAGAFTGAQKMKKGLLEVANGGTFFLDEIGDMPHELQAKMLRAIEERKIRRVGSTTEIEVDIRLITATHRDLEELVREGKFREDLYYRLNVVPIHLPPLRARPEDIGVLVEHFIGIFNQEFGTQVSKVDPPAMQALRSYSWPGNIRELRNMLERTILLECNGNTLKLEHLKFQRKELMAKPEYGKDSGEGAKSFGTQVGSSVSLEEVEKQHIQEVLGLTGGNKNQAAQILGIDRTTLYNKLRKYQIGKIAST